MVGWWDGGMVELLVRYISSILKANYMLKDILNHHLDRSQFKRTPHTKPPPKNHFDTLFFLGGCKRNKQIQKISPCYCAQFSPTKTVPKTW